MRLNIVTRCIAGTAFVMHLAAAAAEGPPPTPVEAVEVAVGPIEQVLAAVGTLRGSETVMIRPEVPGRVAEILFNEGAVVAAGMPLLRLDGAIERAELREAEAELELSRLSHQRAQDLMKRGAGSTAERDRTRSEMEADQAAVALARAKLERMTLRAPFAATLGLRRVSPGAYLVAGDDVVSLVKLDPLILDFSVPEVEAAALQAGQVLRLSVDAYPGQHFDGRVYAFEPGLSADSRALAVRASVANASGRLRPGMFARVELVLERETQAISVPESAIVPRGTARHVYRINDGIIEDVPVSTGLREAGMVQITDGLAPGDRVVTAGHLKVRAGAPVVIVEPKAGS